MKRIGLISDTHGLLRPEVLASMQGCDLILHAGDVGSPEILAALAAVAPLSAVRGNNDAAPWAATLPEYIRLDVEGLCIHLIHERAAVARPRSGDVVVYGHSHQPSEERVDGVLYLNPGSAGPRRFSLPISSAWLCVDAGAIVKVEFREWPLARPSGRRG